MIYTDGVHIVADSLEELHTWAMLQKIKIGWYHVGKGKPHYDCPKYFKPQLERLIKQRIISLVSDREILKKSMAIYPKKAETEKQIETHLRTEIEELGGWCIKMVCTYITGLPDRLCLLPGGELIFVELKAPGKKPRKIQSKMHDKLRALGFTVETIDSKEKVNYLIDDLSL